MFKKVIPIIFLFTLLLSSFVNAELSVIVSNWEKKDYVTYYGTSNHTITAAWDAAPGATYYELEILHVERNTKTSIASGHSLTATQKTFLLPRTGHYIVSVRACDSSISNCSEWVSSLEGTVDGVKRAWWIYAFVAPPGPIVVH
jgi:hypothetical protein